MAELEVDCTTSAQYEQSRRAREHIAAAGAAPAQKRPGHEAASDKRDHCEDGVGQKNHALSGGLRRYFPLASATIMPRIVRTSWSVRSARFRSARIWRIIGVSLLGGYRKPDVRSSRSRCSN